MKALLQYIKRITAPEYATMDSKGDWWISVEFEHLPKALKSVQYQQSYRKMKCKWLVFWQPDNIWKFTGKVILD